MGRESEEILAGLKVHIISLFPGFFKGPFSCGPVRIVQEKAVLKVEIVNPRDFTDDPHGTVDGYPFGGGCGMVLKPDPVFRAVESIRQEKSHVVLLSPQGHSFNQSVAREFSQYQHLVLICGRYKGIDERVRTELADDEVSIGDYILSGGEAAALVIVESVARLLPGAVGHEESVTTDSFSSNILDAPYYTRPQDFRGNSVPEVLLSGDHAAVRRWRRKQALLTTAQRRPDLLRNEILTQAERQFLLAKLEKEITNGEEKRDQER